MTTWGEAKISSVFLHTGNRQLDAVVFDGDRLVVPPLLCKTALDELHKGRLGVEKMISLARHLFWWQELAADIHKTAKNCEVCLNEVHSHPKQLEFIARELRSMAIYLHRGSFLNQYHALVLIDCLSEWPAVVLKSTLTTSFVIPALRNRSSVERISQVLVNDKGVAVSCRWSEELAPTVHTCLQPHTIRKKMVQQRTWYDWRRTPS